MKAHSSSTNHISQDPPLYTIKPSPYTPFNRIFAAIYSCGLLALFFRHAKTLLYSPTSSSFFTTLLLLFSDLVLAFMWSTLQAMKMNPIRREEFPENLEKFIKTIDDFPPLDVFIFTADPYKEPPMSVVNTALSVMAYDYPAEKISVYVSDDGGSSITLFAFMEAAKFARQWLPFCRKNNIVPRSPDVFFRTNHSSSSEAQAIKAMYESMKQRVDGALEQGVVGDEFITSDEERAAFGKWTDNFTPKNHPTVIQILLEKGIDKDIDGSSMPNLIYVSREKNKNYSHHFKAGAQNVLIRVSAVMTNAPIILTLDCDMYSNDPQTPRRALCYYLDPKIRSGYAYIQFPQLFHGINKHDIYASELKRFFIGQSLGFDGLRGANHVGTGCFFNRRAFFGSPSNLILPEIPELSPYHVVDKWIKSDQTLALAHKVASSNFEEQTDWGDQVSEAWFRLYVLLFIGAYAQDYIDLALVEGTFRKWWNDQRIWFTRGVSQFFAVIEFVLKSSGISAGGFDVTAKVVDDEQRRRYEQGIFEFGVHSYMFVPLIMAALINFLAFTYGVVKFLKGEDLNGLLMQTLVSGYGVVNCWPIYEAMFLRSDGGKLPLKTTVMASFLTWILYLMASFVLG